jgi:hypothetical protein
MQKLSEPVIIHPGTVPVDRLLCVLHEEKRCLNTLDFFLLFFFADPDPEDPYGFGLSDPNPDLSSKNSKKNIDSYCSLTSL